MKLQLKTPAGSIEIDPIEGPFHPCYTSFDFVRRDQENPTLAHVVAMGRLLKRLGPHVTNLSVHYNRSDVPDRFREARIEMRLWNVTGDERSDWRFQGEVIRGWFEEELKKGA